MGKPILGIRLGCLKLGDGLVDLSDLNEEKTIENRETLETGWTKRNKRIKKNS